MVAFDSNHVLNGNISADIYLAKARAVNDAAIHFGGK
jgi:hypothetical protein